MEFFEKLIAALDWLFAEAISPLFRLVGEGFEFAVLKPLILLNLPVAYQVAVIGVLTGMISQLIRMLIRAEQKETAFQQKFAAKKSLQQPIADVADWKARDVLYRASDRELDEDFNVYLAQRFARYGIVYMLPIFMLLFWLESVLPKETLVSGSNGIYYALSLPHNNFGFEGLTVSTVFLVSYVLFQIAFFSLRKNLRKRRKFERLCLQ